MAADGPVPAGFSGGWGECLPSLSIPLPMIGVPVNGRVSSKIRQLLDTLRRPKRPPLREFFLDDAEEALGGERPAGSGGRGLRTRKPHTLLQLWSPCGSDVASGPLPAELPAWETGCPWLRDAAPLCLWAGRSGHRNASEGSPSASFPFLFKLPFQKTAIPMILRDCISSIVLAPVQNVALLFMNEVYLWKKRI